MRKIFVCAVFLFIIAVLVPYTAIADVIFAENTEEAYNMELYEEFFSWEVISTYAGCLALTILLTQFLKPVWPQSCKIQYLSYIIAAILLNAASLVLGKFTWAVFGLNFINAVVISFAANGGYNNFKEAIEETNIGDEPKDD